ncbi:hypothetical protein E4U21_007249 [Claviceps maximensis]|nr:hypothetical protein E4U21_007249 [Claviceps maximensis]
MPLPPVPHVFDTGLKYFFSPSGSLDALIRQQLEFAARDVGMMNNPPPGSGSEDLVVELGEYLTRTAMLWAQLTEQLVHGPHIAQTTIQAHERSRIISQLSDLAEVARIDVNVAKLRSSMDYPPNINADMSGSDCSSSEDDEQFQSIDMDALRQRGKGVYLCPKGLKCDKGGVDKDGKLAALQQTPQTLALRRTWLPEPSEEEALRST